MIDYRRLKRQLVERIEWYALSIRHIYFDLSEKLVRLAKQASHEYDAEKPFTFAAYPEIDEQAEQAFAELRSRTYSVIENAKKNERTFSDLTTATIIEDAMGGQAGKHPAYATLFAEKPPEMNRRELERPVRMPLFKPPGASPEDARRFELSGRVWNLSGQFKDEIQRLIDDGIRDGLSADHIAKRAQQYLNDPDRFYRRFRAEGNSRIWKRRVLDEKTGKYRWVNASPEAYHPGRGVYRSSYKNAMRLARTEINMAHHEQAYARWQELDFVVGFRVVLSPAHPVYDICDELQGEYPKTFKFVGWHPQCMCHTEAILRGQGSPVNDVPENFKKWVEDNADRIAEANYKGTTPWFLLDNEKYVHLGNFQATGQQKFTVDSRREYLRHDTEKWRRDYFNRKNGGYLTVERERIEQGKINKQEREKYEKEYGMCSVLAKNGYKVEYLKMTEGSFDIYLNGVSADLKKLSSHNNIARHAKHATRGQGAGVIVFEFEKMTGGIQNALNKLKYAGMKVKYFITGTNQVIDL